MIHYKHTCIDTYIHIYACITYIHTYINAYIRTYIRTLEKLVRLERLSLNLRSSCGA